jgi:hypothetical protein
VGLAFSVSDCSTLEYSVEDEFYGHTHDKFRESGAFIVLEVKYSIDLNSTPNNMVRK